MLALKRGEERFFFYIFVNKNLVFWTEYFLTFERCQGLNAKRWTKSAKYERWTIELNYFLERQQACVKHYFNLYCFKFISNRYLVPRPQPKEDPNSPTSSAENPPSIAAISKSLAEMDANNGSNHLDLR